MSLSQCNEIWKTFYFDYIDRGYSQSKAEKLADQDYEKWWSKKYGS